MIACLRRWLGARLARGGALGRDVRRHEAAADRLDLTLRELLQR